MKKGPCGPSVISPEESISGIEDPQLERLADRLRAVHDVQLAQDLLHVVLHRERADLEDRADLEVALAEIDPLQDVLLAHREHALVVRLVRGAGRARHLRAHPGRVHGGREELREIGLAWADAARTADEGEKAERAAVGVVHAVREKLRRAEARELARELTG